MTFLYIIFSVIYLYCVIKFNNYQHNFTLFFHMYVVILVTFLQQNSPIITFVSESCRINKFLKKLKS